MNNEIEIVCPECSRATTGHLVSTVCECGQPLTSDTKPTKYIKKPWIVISTTVAFLSGVVGTVGGEYYLLKENLSNEKTVQSNASNRYSINDEYLIVNSCTSGDERPLKRSYLMDKKEICVCALEKTQHDYDYSSYKQNESIFFKAFEKNVDECMNINASAAAMPAAEASPY